MSHGRSILYLLTLISMGCQLTSGSDFLQSHTLLYTPVGLAGQVITEYEPVDMNPMSSMTYHCMSTFKCREQLLSSYSTAVDVNPAGIFPQSQLHVYLH